MAGKKMLLEKLAQVEAAIQELLTKAEADDGDDARLTELDAEADDLKAQISAAGEREETRACLAAKSAARQAELEKPTTPLSGPPRVTDMHDRVADDPKGGFNTYTEFVTAVKSGSAPGSVADERLRMYSAAQGANTEVGSEGGFLVPTDFSNRMFERIQGELGVVGQCDRLTLGGNSVVINGSVDHDRSGTTYRHGGIVVYWVGEGDQVTRSSLKFNQISLRLQKLAALSYATDEELQDVANFGDRLLSKQAIAINEELTEAIMFGNGVGKPKGAFADTNICVEQAKETNQAADTLVAENLINMNSVIWSQSRGKGSWYFNGECLPQLETMAIAVGTGGIPVYMGPNGLSERGYGTIKGRPAIETDHCEALGDAGDIVFADFSQYLLATKGTVNTAMSIHLRFDYFETAFRSEFRVDGKPAWDQNLKPRKGASTRRVSPFVKLAARA